jgi:hypothetical protein
MPKTSATNSRFGPRPAAACVGTAVFLLGFGVMSLLSATGRWEAGRSMWHYRAATWGDILLVPGICAILAAGLGDRRIRRQQGEKGWALSGAFVFSVSGLAVQASWLASSKPILNWTLPEPHHFSTPGWYHAAYLVVLSGVIGGAGTVLARRIRAGPERVRDEVSRERATGLLVGFTWSFGLLLYLDSADSLHTSAGDGSALGAVGAVVLIGLLALYTLGLRRALVPLATGLAVTAAVFAGTVITHGLA